MRRRPLTRALAAILAAWLALVLGEPAALRHHCPMHDGPVPQGAAPTHAAHGGSHAPAENAGSHGCTCVGDCTAAGGTAVPTSQPAVPPLRISATRDAEPREHKSRPLSRRAFALPFANGPPLARAS